MESKNTTKKLIISTIMLFVLAAITVTGMVFAYRNQSIDRSFDTVIKSSNVTFLFNNTTYLDSEIGEDDIDLHKGAETDVDMLVEVIGSTRVVVDYRIEFEIEYKKDDNAQREEEIKKNSEDLLTAIEVYKLTDGKYEFLCMLSELASFEGDDSKVSGIMVTEHTEVIPLKFVFSAAAGGHYDELALSEDIGFKIKATATAYVSSSTEQYVFASNAEQFKDEFTLPENVGKTIILVADITLEEPLTSKGIMGIELNGCTLTVKSDVTVACGASAYDTSLRLGVTNNKSTGGLDADGGRIIVTGLRNCYLVDNRITTNQGSIIGGDVSIVMSDEQTHTAVFNDLVNLLKERAAAAVDIVYHAGDDVSFLFKDVFGYFNKFSLAIADNSVVQNDSPFTAGGFYIIDADNDMTERFQFTFYISTYEDGPFNVNLTKNVSGFITLRGNSVEAIGLSLLDSLPGLISSSQLLRTYDVVTGAHIDWYVDDHMDGELLDSRGVYRSSGLADLMPKLKNSSGDFDFSDRPADIYVKVSKSDSQTGGYNDDPAERDNGSSIVKSDGTVMKKFDIVTVSAKERTTLLFDNVAITIGNNMPAYDVENYLNDFYEGIHLESATKLLKIRLELIDHPDDSPAVNKGYVEVAHVARDEYGDPKYELDKDGNPVLVYETCEDGEHCTEEKHIIKLKDDVEVPQNTLNNLMCNIIFVYKDGKECVITKTIGVSGGLAEVTPYDMSYTLQSAFVGNDYTEGIGDEFYAYGALRPRVNGISVAVFVDYTVEGSARNYLSVTYKFVEVTTFNEQVAYFTRSGDETTGYQYTYVDTTSDTSKTYYERKAVIQVLNSRVPTVDQITAYLTAHLYTVYYEYDVSDVNKVNPINWFRDTSGNKITGTPDRNEDTGRLIYVDPTTGIRTIPGTNITYRAGEPLSFGVSLEIMGVIRNTDAHIADTQLYNILLQIFDAPNAIGVYDGVITSKEAEDWAGAVARDNARSPANRLLSTYTDLDGNTVYYINLAGRAISSLKGLEYFKGVTGYNLDNTGLANVTIFESLPNIMYLSFANNLVTDLTPLRYLDRLVYLNASGNRITTIEPLKYLMRLQSLNIASNTSIYDFDALTVSTSLRTVTVTGLTSSTGASIDSDATLVYQFALLQINCPDVQVLFTNASGAQLNLKATPAALVAAKVMRDLEDINRTQGTLYLPTYYYYEDESATVTRYQLFWHIPDVTETNLILTYLDGDPVVKYTIINPIQDKPVKLGVMVYPPEGSLDSFFFSRAFNLTLEASYETYTPYVYSHTVGSGVNAVHYYVEAETAIPDRALRNKLFSLFNSDTTSTITVTLEDGTQLVNYPNLYVLSNTELAYKGISTSYYLDHLGIRSLKGIEYFSNALYGLLYLQNNNFESEDLAYLYRLNYITSLTLGGAKFDFTDLLSKNSEGELIFDTSGRAYRSTSLTSLYVSGCYALEEEETLAQLYEIYCSRTASSTGSYVNIYITSTVWNPYTNLLAREVSKLKSTATLSRVGDTFNIYTENGGQAPTVSSDTTRGIPITVYNTTAKLRCSVTPTYSYYAQSFANMSTAVTLNNASYYLGFYPTINASHTGNIVYLRSFAHEMTVTVRMSLQFTDRRGTAVIHNYYYLHVNIDDGSKYLDVYEDGTGKYLGTFDEVVASYELRTVVLSPIYAYISSNWTTQRVANIGALGNANFYAVTSEPYSNYRGRIAISTALLGNTAAVGSTSSITISIYSGDYLIKGLQYFTNIKTLTINTDTSFGDGIDLINIESLTINRASVDFSTITGAGYDYALKSITVNFYYYFNAGYVETDGAGNIINDNSAFKYFKNLESFSLLNRNALYTTANTYYYWVNDLTFLSAITTDGDYPTSNLKTLSAYNISGTSWTSTAAAAGTSLKNATVAKKLYIAALANGNNRSDLTYQIGMPTLHTSPNFFTAIYNGLNAAGTPAYYNDLNNWTAWAGTDNSGNEATRVESWTAASSTEEELSIYNDFTTITSYNYMIDFGLKYEKTDGSYGFWLDDQATNNGYDNGIFNVPVGTEIKLPISTAIAYYGLIFSNDLDSDPVIDPNRDYRIRWSVYVEYANNELKPHEYDATLNTRINKAGDPIYYSEIRDDADELYYTFTPDRDSYVSIIGTLVVTDAVVELPYSYWYEFKVGNGDGIYVNNGTTGVNDKALRWWMFANRNRVTDNITITGSGSYRSLRKYDQYLVEGINGGTTALTALPHLYSYAEYKHITDLTGIGDVVKHWGNVRSDHNGIADIKTFSHTEAKFSDISPLYDLTELTTLTLTGYSSTSAYYQGYIKLYTKVGGVVTSSIAGQLVKLETLSLNYNYSITPEDIKYLAEPCYAEDGTTVIPRALKTLSIYYTRCIYSLEFVASESDGSMIDIIEKLIQNTGNDLSLSLGYSVAETITLTHIANIRSTANPENRYGEGINSGSNIFLNVVGTSMTQSISADTANGIHFTFSYTISANMTTYLKNYSHLVSNKIGVRMQMSTSASSYRQFSGIYVETTFRRGDVLIERKFGRNQDDVDDFDSELIAYLFVKYYSSMEESYSNGTYYYTFNHTASIDFNSTTSSNIAYLVSLHTLNKNGVSANLLYKTAGYSFSVTPAYGTLYYYALSYKEHGDFTITNTQDYKPSRAFVLPSVALIYHSLVKNSFTFMDGSQPSYQAQLPNYIIFKGVTCPIGYYITTTSNSPAGFKTYYTATTLTNAPYSYTQVNEAGPATDVSLNSLYTDSDGNTFLRVNETTVPPVGVTTSFNLFVLTKNKLTASTAAADRYFNSGRSIVLTRLADPLITNTSLNLVEVDIEGGNAVIKAAADDRNDDFIVGSSDLATKIYKNGSTYYNYNPGGYETVYVVDASRVFTSSWLVRYMYLSYSNATYYGLTDTSGNAIDLKNAAHTVYRANNETYGFIMRTEDIKNIAELDVKYYTGSGTYSSYPTRATSISGIEIFQNMKSLILRGGMVTDISPVEKLELETFYYDNSRDYGNAATSIHTGITDFMPLIRGSRASLKFFTYNAGTSQMMDMSFLLGFTSSDLKIYVCSDNVNQYFAYYDNGTVYTSTSSGYTYSQNGLSYFMTSQGRTVLNLLKERDIYIYTNTAVNYSAFHYANTNYAGGRPPLEYDSSSLINGNEAGSGNLAGQAVYALKTSTREEFASDVLKGVDSNIYGVDYTDGFLMTVDASNFEMDTTTVSLAGGVTKTVLDSITYQVDATIVAGSGYYIINWESASASIRTSGIHLTNDLTVTLDDGTVKEYEAVDEHGNYNMLSDEDIAIISDSIDYYNAQKAGITKLVTQITVYAAHEIEMEEIGGEWVVKGAADGELLDLSGRALCRIDFNGYTYDRAFYFEFVA